MQQMFDWIEAKLTLEHNELFVRYDQVLAFQLLRKTAFNTVHLLKHSDPGLPFIEKVGTF